MVLPLSALERNSRFQPGAILSLRGYVAMSGDIFGHSCWVERGKGASGI